jgi:hypothetical protein
MDQNPYNYEVPLEPGVSGLEVAASLVGWLQRECGATAGDYDLDGTVVNIPLRVPARRVMCAGTRLHSRLTRQHSAELVGYTEDLVRRFDARQRRTRSLLREARELHARRSA